MKTTKKRTINQREYVFDVFDENMKPVFYTGTQSQMIHRVYSSSVCEATKKAISHFKKGAKLQLKSEGFLFRSSL